MWHMQSPPTTFLSSNSLCTRCTSRFRFQHTRRYQAHSRQHRSRLQMSMKSDSQYEDFFRYTSGRWVWDEEQQLHDRYRRFNVPEIQRIAAASVGAKAKECVDMKKLAEGSFNKAFRLTMDNGSVVIVRMPNPNAGPTYYTTASEVATMDFVRMPNVMADS